MKKLLIAFLFISTASHAQSLHISDQAKISVVTCGPWQGELYSAFGHSAFRVQDPAMGLDEIYNYGVFDFDQPNFYLNFARGYLYYKLGVHPYSAFKNYYIYHNRYLHEQELNLSHEQTQRLYDYLRRNAMPENANYLYDYFYNNCSTKLRDVVVEVLGDSVKFDGSYITTDYTIRNLTDLYLEKQPWGDLGIDICLGLPMDKKASPYEYMFLPDYLESGFDHATITQGDSTVPLVKQKVIVYESRPQNRKEEEGLPHPVYVFSGLTLVALALMIIDLRRKKLSNWFDVLLFGAAGLIGWLLFILWFFTDHKAAANNLNILWALPTHIVALVYFKKNPAWLSKYFLVVTGILVLLVITRWLMPQQLNYSLIPVVIALAIRAFTQYRLRKAAA
ncbi:MAG TPA: DUF4105 domain-containing protein [Ohtaekwangia sp.]